MNVRRLKMARSVVSECMFRYAASYDSIVDGLDGSIKQRAKSVSLTLSKEGPPRWTYQTSTGHTVNIKASDADLSGDIHVSCSCPYWIYQGPEYHAKQDDYLLGQPEGTATKPTETDPDMNHRVCKHIYAAFQRMR